MNPSQPIIAIADQGAVALDALLILNNANARETSFLSFAEWEHMVAEAFSATCVGPSAFLLTFAPDADYASPNFEWFRERETAFIYVDRIVVGAEHRRSGVARRLYENLFAQALRAGMRKIVCEINADPPNPVSDAFHAAMGFVEVGRACLANGKTVRYMCKRLSQTAEYSTGPQLR